MPKAIYFENESPDFNYGLWGRPERLAANRCILCLMTEFGLLNDKRMKIYQINNVIENVQATYMRK